MADGSHQDVTSTLSELESKLIELERELLTVAGGLPADTVVPTTPASPASGAPMTPFTSSAPAAPVPTSLRAEIDELMVVRDRLRAIADDLVARCDHLVDRLEQADARSSGDQPSSGAAAH